MDMVKRISHFETSVKIAFELNIGKYCKEHDLTSYSMDVYVDLPADVDNYEECVEENKELVVYANAILVNSYGVETTLEFGGSVNLNSETMFSPNITKFVDRMKAKIEKLNEVELKVGEVNYFDLGEEE